MSRGFRDSKLKLRATPEQPTAGSGAGLNCTLPSFSYLRDPAHPSVLRRLPARLAIGTSQSFSDNIVACIGGEMRRGVGKFRDSELKLRLAVRAAGIGIWDWDIASGVMEYSPRARSICGFTPDEPVTIQKARDVTHPEDLPWTSALARQALDPSIRAREPYEYRIRRADTGELRWVVAHGEAIFAKVNGQKRAVRYVGTIADITARRCSEALLRESQLRQQLAIDAAGMAVWEYDIATEKVSFSPELKRIFGLPDEAEPTIEELRKCYYPGDREKVAEIAQKSLAAGETQFEAEFRCRWPDGTVRWLLLRAEVLFSERGNMDRVIGVVMDIDERKRAEQRQHVLLRELNHRVKNSLAVVQSIAIQTFGKGRADPDALSSFSDRLGALAKANEIVLLNEWAPFSALELVRSLTEPYRSSPPRILIQGGDFNLPAAFNVPLAMIIHELATNAAKYGSLSSSDGGVTIELRTALEEFTIVWREYGGPPVSASPREGFGTTLITRVLAVDIGNVELRFEPDGIVCRISGKRIREPCSP